MICLDIDGTLLNSEHKITGITKEMIQIADQHQIIVVLVSARMPEGMIFLQEELGIRQPLICYGGALILDKKRKVLLEQAISIPDIKKIYIASKNNDIHISLYKNDYWFIEKMDVWSENESKITNTIPDIIDYSGLFEAWAQNGKGPNKVLCMSDPAKISLLEVCLKDCFMGKLNVYTSKPTYLEIMPENATKAAAIDFLAHKHGILSSEIIAVGDNYNDIDMIKNAGLGIAMGNAPDGVKQYANDVTLTNDEDGVAEVIKKYIL
jgi:Cof subfamily protein (haloacid dehalogenase superfamily)